MLRQTKDLQGLAMVATDEVKDFCFDDQAWAIRYHFVDAGSANATRAEADRAQARGGARQRDNDAHLRSFKTAVRYHIGASDGKIRHVHCLHVDEESWAIRCLVVSTSNWWLGHDESVAAQRIKRVTWAKRTKAVDLTRDALKQAPGYDPALPLSLEMEIAEYKHHGRAGYWPSAARPSDSAVRSRVEA
ncbi:MAG: hypothetical protein H7346_19430 [Burkholderiaceae bacterium]|nr:hypothetical protein [Burkholderiaceae bacterium]